MSIAWALAEDPKRLAGQLLEAGRDDPAWLAAFTHEFESHALPRELPRFLVVWGLSQSEAARLFKVSRQALSKWLSHGVPADRLETMADLAAATDLLVRYLKADRIPGVVRRRAAGLGDRSLVELVGAGDSHATLEACRAMFDFTAVQS
ncbi:MAG: hypothetical protein ACLQK4_09590 [Acidimicrobiales bacterium]|jgi:hypothetical protein